MNLLFICSRNEWRSRTAETIFKKLQGHKVRSAGTSAQARIRVSVNDIHWADFIFVMENMHRQRLQDKFGDLLNDKALVVLEIEDNYPYMDPDLIEMLEDMVLPYLEMD